MTERYPLGAFKARLNILSLSHFLELYGAASVAPMWFPIVMSLLLRRGSTSSLSHSHEPYGAASVAPMRFCCVLSLLLR